MKQIRIELEFAGRDEFVLSKTENDYQWLTVFKGTKEECVLVSVGYLAMGYKQIQCVEEGGEQRIINEVIDKFFKTDEIHFRDIAPPEIGTFWVCRHEGFHTLTYEPADGGHYEIAVRICKKDGRWQGYKIHKFDSREGYLVGKNTGGH